MKKILSLILCATMVSFMLVGCAGGGKSTLENPMKPVDGVEAFTKLDVYMNPPDGAKEVTYYTIGKKIAQIDFALDGIEYTYRGSTLEEDISGINEEFVGDPLKITTKGGAEIQIKATTSDARIATWKNSGASYCLLAAKDAKGESMAVLSQQIAQYQEDAAAK